MRIGRCRGFDAAVGLHRAMISRVEDRSVRMQLGRQKSGTLYSRRLCEITPGSIPVRLCPLTLQWQRQVPVVGICLSVQSGIPTYLVQVSETGYFIPIWLNIVRLMRRIGTSVFANPVACFPAIPSGRRVGRGRFKVCLMIGKLRTLMTHKYAVSAIHHKWYSSFFFSETRISRYITRYTGT